MMVRCFSLTIGLARSVPFGIAALLLLAGSAMPDDAVGLSRQDLPAVGRVLRFLDPPPVGSARLLVVYAGGVPGSRREASRIAAWLAHGLPVGDLVLSSRLVEQAALDAQRGYDGIVIADGVSADAVRAAMTRAHVPCLTAHLAQVEQGACLVAIRSEPTLSIVLNHRASERAGVRFATAFRLMVREL